MRQTQQPQAHRFLKRNQDFYNLVLGSKNYTRMSCPGFLQRPPHLHLFFPWPQHAGTPPAQKKKSAAVSPHGQDSMQKMVVWEPLISFLFPCLGFHHTVLNVGVKTGLPQQKRCRHHWRLCLWDHALLQKVCKVTC